MSPMNRMCLLTGVAALTLSGASQADTTLEQQNDELRSRISQLEQRLMAVEAQNGENWLTEQRAAEIRGVVTDILADADERSSLLNQGGTAGYDDGAYLASSDGNWLLKTNLLMQTRFLFNTQGNPPGTADNTVFGFEVTRTTFMLSGHVVDPSWFYRLDIEVSTNGGGIGGVTGDTRTGLLNAYAGHTFDGWSLTAGQYLTPLLRSELVGAQHQQAVERSFVNYLFTGSYTQGVMVDWSNEQLRVRASAGNGVNDIGFGGSVVTSPAFGLQATALASDTKYALTGRVDWLAMGDDWSQFDDISSKRGENMALLVGGALHVQDAEDQVALPVQLTVLTVDASAEFGGANVYGALVYANVDPSVGGAASRSPWAFEIGGGYMLDDNWEVFGRYEFADQDIAGADDISLMTVGFNRYFKDHNLKWTTDLVFGLDAAPAAVPATGVRLDTVGEDSQFLMRSQLQLLF